MEVVRPRRRKTYFPRMHPMALYDEVKFQQRYRLSKDTVRTLADGFENSGICSTSLDPRGGGLSAEDRVCLAIRYLATGSNFSLIGDYQGVTKATVSYCVRDFVAYMYTKQQDYIHFPMTEGERYVTAQGFYDRYGGKPLCIGCVDGSHIPILTPSVNEPAYCNRKGYHSVNAMIISDSRKMITHVDPTWPGSVNDAYILRSSEIGIMGEEGGFGSYYLLGDAGYPLKPYLFTPLRNPVTNAERRYNQWQKSTRASVESTLGILKQRWRAIDESGGYLYHSPVKAGQVIVSCVCLHNIARLTSMAPPPLEDEEDGDAVRPYRVPRPQPVGIRVAAPVPIDTVQSRMDFIVRQFGQRRMDRGQNVEE